MLAPSSTFAWALWRQHREGLFIVLGYLFLAGLITALACTHLARHVAEIREPEGERGEQQTADQDGFAADCDDDRPGECDRPMYAHEQPRGRVPGRVLR